jgi:RNA polymerase sigma-70 factor (ECF subfamily)
MRDVSAPRLPEPAPPEALQDIPKSAARVLAEQAALGDLAATRKLLEAVAPRLLAVVATVLGRAHPDVDDVGQQALIAFVQSLASFRGECEPVYYGTRIAVRTAVAAKKRARLLWSRRDDDAAPEAMQTRDVSPQEHARLERRRALLRELLDELPDEQADSLVMRFMLGWSLEEVAAATGAPVNTVRSRVRLAKEALRRRIEANPDMIDTLDVGGDRDGEVGR